MARTKFRFLLAIVIVFTLTFGLVGQALAAAQPPEMVKVLIGFDRQPGPSEEGIVRGAGGAVKYTYHLVPAIAASIPEAAIQGLLKNPRVTSVDLDIEVRAVDQVLPWGVDRIDAEVVHAAGNTGAEVKVAIIDSGINYNHPDLGANYAGGYDFVNGDTDPMDDNGHGTHVAGTVAAEDNDIGVVGVAPEVELYALKVLGANGSGYYSDVIAALQWAVDNGIQVTNNSYGSSGDPGAIVKAAFDNAYDNGVLHVAAAGNAGNPPGKGDNVIYPARWASVIAVAATDKSDSRPRWSSTGPDVELAAPGVAINSTLRTGGYGEYSGTSMASPHVAGTAALVIATGITDANSNGRINDEVRLRLQQTADDLGDPGRDTKYGYGLVDADEAAIPSGPVNYPPTVSITSPADDSTFNSGATISFAGTASDSEDGDLTASLVWTSDIVGQIGTGGSFSITLSDGNHTITASVTDTGGKTESASISITVGTPTTATTVSVASITYATEGGRYGLKHLLITIALVDDLNNAVSGASVSIKLDNTTTGQSWTGTGTTGTDGTVTFSLKNAPSGTYTTTATDVTADGLTWDGITPPNSFDK
ncbi:MAG: S8 family serine peptidase [Dehalococcoidales bacterium]